MKPTLSPPPSVQTHILIGVVIEARDTETILYSAAAAAAGVDRLIGG